MNIEEETKQAILRTFRIENKSNSPFLTPADVAVWIKEKFFPHGKIMGYDTSHNPFAEIGQRVGGHDFLVVGRYIIDLWPLSAGETIKGHQPFIDTHTEKELALRFYGDANKWDEFKQ